MKKVNFFLTERAYVAFGLVVVWFILMAAFPDFAFYSGWILLAGVLALTVFDGFKLFSSKIILKASRSVTKVLSLSDENEVSVSMSNLSSSNLAISFIDILPDQLQIRDFKIRLSLGSGEHKTVSYQIIPKTRGEYHFGDLYFFVRSSFPGLVERRVIIPAKQMTAVFPSIKQMQEIELQSFSKISINQGVKRIRRIGHSYEFEQIKSYVRGDDYRSINWKATSRRQSLMINQYEDQRSQPVYFVIDKGRSMKMPFNGLTLVDYAVNTTLAISNVALKKGDKVGMITFDKSIDYVLRSSDKTGQLAMINHALYNLEQSDVESGFENLYAGITANVRQRSLLFLFTNCNTLHSLKRIRPVLQLLNRQHLLVVIMFENTLIAELAKRKAYSAEEIYEVTIAEQYLYEQRQIALELNTIGIQTIVSAPEDLSINTINKYLSLKARGMI
ncbi:MAG: DUF58 domain-containing protein [Bacteroidetes bacterium]|nr:DUF58 domain-containing protein [Bacteroidota bacterium]